VYIVVFIVEKLNFAEDKNLNQEKIKSIYTYKGAFIG